VAGGVLATDRVEMKPGARVFADVEAPVVVIEEGVVFDGHCRMARSGDPAQGVPPPGREPAAPAGSAANVVPLAR
jgi:cytoskeletal protein CcmA (bactofilin family)